MFLTEPNTPKTGIELLAPVQATPFFTGIVGSPTGVDANGQTPGGGGVTSFAFNSIYVSSSGSGANETVTVAQLRQWSLTDIVGTSSAFYAEVLENQIAEWEANPIELLKLLWQYADDILKWIEGHLSDRGKTPAKAFVMRATAAPPAPHRPRSWPRRHAVHGRTRRDEVQRVRARRHRSRLLLLAGHEPVGRPVAKADAVRGWRRLREHRHQRDARIQRHRQPDLLRQHRDPDDDRDLRRVRRQGRLHSEHLHRHRRVDSAAVRVSAVRRGRYRSV